MNALDELLASAGRVEDIGPAGLRNGRAPLESAIRDAHSEQAATMELPGWPASANLRFTGLRLWPGGLRRKIIVACTAAAATAVATIVAIGLSSHPGTPRLAESGANPAMKASQRPASRHTFAAGSTELTATIVFHEAAEAAKAAGTQQEGWPDAAYWQADSIEVRAGKTYRREAWISHYGNGVLEDGSVGPGLIPLGAADFPVGDKRLTWNQLYALPTDPAKLASVLTHDSMGSPFHSQAANLWNSVMDLLVETPASPALREALYEVAADIPGVAVNGEYTDSLGRTGTALGLGEDTLVIDPANGQLLAWIEGDYRQAKAICDNHQCTAKEIVEGVAYTYTSQGPATSEP